MVHSTDIVIKFKIPNVYKGFAKTNGLLKVGDDHIIFEYETKDSIIGILSSQIKIKILPIKYVTNLYYKKRLFGDKLIIEYNKIDVLGDFPRSDINRLKLRIPKHYRESVKEFMHFLETVIAEEKIKKVENF